MVGAKVQTAGLSLTEVADAVADVVSAMVVRCFDVLTSTVQTDLPMCP